MNANTPIQRRNSIDVAAARQRCLRYRRRVLDISQQVGALHIAPAFSCLETVDTIYHELMRRAQDKSTVDTFLMSKGHGCVAQYVVLEELGILTDSIIYHVEQPRRMVVWYAARPELIGMASDEKDIPA